MSADYAALVSAACDTEPQWTAWSAQDIAPLTLAEIDIVRAARQMEFEEKFAETFSDSTTATELREALDKPALVLQARVLSGLELAARLVLFEDAVEEAGRRDHDENFGEDDERDEDACQRAKGDQLDGVKS